MNNNLKEYLFLFDIDGTILDSQGAGLRAFSQAFEELLNKKIDIEINFLGGIDNIIFKNLYDHYLFPSSYLENNWQKFKKIYLKYLLKFSKNCFWILYPNADNVIISLYNKSNLGLVTGNIQKGAMIKLKKFNLHKYFKTGGFGDASDNRNKLVENAIENCEKKFEKKFNRKKIFLFGDTEKDIESAVSNGIIPVLIDHKNKFIGNYEKLPTKFYGNFKNINLFFANINNINDLKKIFTFY